MISPAPSASTSGVPSGPNELAQTRTIGAPMAKPGRSIEKGTKDTHELAEQVNRNRRRRVISGAHELAPQLRHLFRRLGQDAAEPLGDPARLRIERLVAEQHAAGRRELRLLEPATLEARLRHDELHEPADGERHRAEHRKDRDE